MSYKPKVLLIEDTVTMQAVYSSVLVRGGYTTDCVATLAEARQHLNASYYPIILLDLNLPDGNGLDLLSDVLAVIPDSKVIVITANGSLRKAVDAMRKGAFDFLVKPFNSDRLADAVDAAYKELRNASAPSLLASIREQSARGFIGNSDKIQLLRDKIESISKTTHSVFVVGEPGVEKGLCISLLHENSPYSGGRFAEVDCADPDQERVASELFDATYFDDSTKSAENALGCTLVLKEVADLSPDNQLQLAQKLREIARGGNERVNSRLRIIATSSKEPFTQVREGRFRQDLFFLLYLVPIEIPPLRERREDIIPCAEHVIQLASARLDREPPILSEAAKARLTAYDWPGNRRELTRLIENVMTLYDARVIEPKMLGPEISRSLSQKDQEALRRGKEADLDDFVISRLVGLSLGQIEQRVIQATIDHCDGSVPKAAEILDVAPSTLYRKLDAWIKSAAE